MSLWHIQAMPQIAHAPADGHKDDLPIRRNANAPVVERVIAWTAERVLKIVLRHHLPIRGAISFYVSGVGKGKEHGISGRMKRGSDRLLAGIHADICDHAKVAVINK